MTDVLGFKKYAGQGGDWVRFSPFSICSELLKFEQGSYILRIMGSLYPDAAPTLHFNMFRCPQTSSRDENALSESEKVLSARRAEFGKTGHGYLDIQSTKVIVFAGKNSITYVLYQPLTIGVAVGASPLAILAYIGEKIYAWSDPGCLNTDDILDTAALYYLSRSFASSVMIYHQVAQELFTFRLLILNKTIEQRRPFGAVVRSVEVEGKEQNWVLSFRESSV